MIRPPFRMVHRDFTGATPELTDNELRVGVTLAHHTDYETSVWGGTLQRLELICGWTGSRRTMLRTLHSLKAKGWIDFDVEPRQRRPWVIRLTGLSVASASQTASPGAHSMTQSSASCVGDESAADGSTMRGDAASELRHETASPPSTSTALRGGEDDLGWGDRESDEISLSEETALPDVRKFAERGRALRAEQEAEPVGEHEFVRLLFEQFPGSYWADDEERNGTPGAPPRDVDQTCRSCAALPERDRQATDRR